MSDIKVKEYKFSVDGELLTFRLDFKALVKFEEIYDNALMIFNNFLFGRNVYSAIIKILSCSCVEKDFTYDELLTKLPFNFGQMKELDDIVKGLTEEIFKETEEGNTEKN